MQSSAEQCGAEQSSGCARFITLLPYRDCRTEPSAVVNSLSPGSAAIQTAAAAIWICRVGQSRAGQGREGKGRARQGRTGLGRAGKDRAGPAMTRLDREASIGQDRTGLVRAVQGSLGRAAWTDQDRTGLVRAVQGPTLPFPVGEQLFSTALHV